MTRFLRFFLVMLFLAGVQLTAKADDEKYEVMEVDGVWYRVHYSLQYHSCENHENAYHRLEPDWCGTTVICPPDGYPPYSGDINIKDQLEFYLDGDLYPTLSDVNYIEDNAFKNSDITSVYIPPRVYTIGKSAFENCHNLQKVEFGVFNEWELMGYDNESHSCYYIGRKLSTIDNYAFRNCTSLKNIIVPNILRNDHTIAASSASLFEGCTSLETVKFEEGLTSIGSYWFNNCTNLFSVSMPSSVKSIHHYAFRLCSSLRNIELSKNLETIYECAFAGCFLLNSVTYEGVDEKLANKYSMVLPEGLKSIYSAAFLTCDLLKSVYLPASLEKINVDGIFTKFPTFSNLDLIDVDKNSLYFASVDNVLYSKDMKTLYKFAGSKDTYFTVPQSVTTIEHDAFASYGNLKGIKFNDGLTHIKKDAFCGTGIKEVTIPHSLKVIDEYAFDGCKSLEYVQLNEGLETIGRSAFFNCPVKKVNLPSSLKEIGNGAFWKSNIDCTPLTVINYSETPLPITSNSSLIFNEQPDLQKMYVPKGCKEAYENAEGLYAHWAKCFTIYEMDELDGIEKTTNDGMKFNIAGDYLSIDNADNGTAVSIYGIDGRLLTSDRVRNGAANINISKHKGRVAILRIGDKKHKVVL